MLRKALGLTPPMRRPDVDLPEVRREAICIFSAPYRDGLPRFYKVMIDDIEAGFREDLYEASENPPFGLSHEHRKLERVCFADGELHGKRGVVVAVVEKGMLDRHTHDNFNASY